jgi:hypothetical protein
MWFIVPFALKKQLLDEWRIVSKEIKANSKLLKLPKPVNSNVKTILRNFLKFKSTKLQSEGLSLKAIKDTMHPYLELFAGTSPLTVCVEPFYVLYILM